MMNIIKGHTSVFQLIGDAYVKNDIQRFYYAYRLCIRAKTNMNNLHKYLINRHSFKRSKCFKMLMKARNKNV